MAPAALHRQSEPMSVSRRFIIVSSRLLTASMAPLAIGMCLDVYLVARVIVQTQTVAVMVAVSLLDTCLVFWLLLPRIEHKSRRRA